MNRLRLAVACGVLVVLGAIGFSVTPARAGISSSPPASGGTVQIAEPVAVEMLMPDGGMRVTLGNDVVAINGGVSATLVGTPTVAVSGTVPVSGSVGISGTPAVTLAGSPSVTATISGTPTVAVSGTVPVSGSVSATISGTPSVNVASSVRLDTNITNTYVPVAGDSAGARLEVAVPAGVAVTGTPSVSVTNVPTVALQNGTQVALTSTSLTALTAATGKGSCTYVESSPALSLGSTATNIPSSPMASRTAVTVTNTSTNSNKRVQCVPGGTASAAAGKPIYAGGATWKWEGATAGWTLSCICVDNGSASTGCTYQVEEERCYQ